MSTRVLVVEDMDILYKILYNNLQDGLPMEKFQFIRVSTMRQALEVLDEDWDVILMDYHLGTLETKKDGVQFYTGADLVTYRRKFEAENPERKRAQIVGITGPAEFCEKLAEAGSDMGFPGGGRSSRGIIEYLQTWCA